MNESTCTAETIDGSNITRGKSVFSYNSRYLSAACNDHVRVYSVKTGLLVHTLRRHEADVTGIRMHPRNPQQLVSVSLDGNMIVWDPADGACLKVINFNVPLYGFCFRPTVQDNDLCLLIQRKSKGKKQIEEKEVIVAVILSWVAVSAPSSAEDSPALLLDKAPSLMWNLRRGKVAFTYQGSHLVGFSRKHLLIYDFHLDTTVSHRQDYQITSIATHPSQECIATGNERGQILLWYDFLNPRSAPLTSLLHWHAHSVNDMCFMHDGAYLLSVGIEGVLVLWQVDTQQSHFRPRLGGVINSVSVSQKDEWIALGMQSNVIQVLSAQNNEVQTTSGGLRKAYLNSAADNGVLTGLVREPQSERLVLNSSLGNIQFYSPLTRQLSEEVNVTNLNYVSQADHQAPIIPTVIVFVAFSDRGQWMATVEHRDDSETVEELRMKFWAFKPEAQSYELNTLVDPPHLRASITGLGFQPSHQSINSDGSPACVTTATNGHFKVWRLMAHGMEDNSPPGWVCSCESHYLEEPALGCSFSEDGSLLAVLYGKHLTLWRMETTQLKDVLSVPHQNETFRCACFGRQGCTHLLVAASSSYLTVWDLPSSSVYWSVRCDLEYIVSSPFSTYMAAFVRSEGTLNVCVFTPKCPKPVSVHEEVCESPLLGAVFLRDAGALEEGDARQKKEGDLHWSHSSSLYFLSSEQVLFRVGRQREEAKQQLHLTSYEGESQTAFEQIFGWRPEVGSESQEEDTVPSSVSSRGASKLFSGPPHTLPPVSSLCSTFLAALVKGPETKREAAVDVTDACADDTEDNNDSGSETSESSLHGDTMTGFEKKQTEPMEQKMDTSGSTTAPTVAATADPYTAVGNFMWLTKFFKSIKWQQ